MRQKKTQVMTIAFIFASVEDKFETNSRYRFIFILIKIIL